MLAGGGTLATPQQEECHATLALAQSLTELLHLSHHMMSHPQAVVRSKVCCALNTDTRQSLQRSVAESACLVCSGDQRVRSSLTGL